MRNPCYKCKRRTSNCHSSCKEYRDYRKTKDVQNDKVRAGKRKYEFTQSVIVESCSRTTHKKPGRY